MNTWFPSSTSSSCIHKHAIGCRHLSSICCLCALCCSDPSERNRSAVDDNILQNSAVITRPRYCWKCEEYWGTCNPHPPLLSRTNRPLSEVPSGTSIVFEANRISHTSRTSFATAPQHRRLAQSNNIETLREELRAIYHGTLTILNNLQLLSEAHPMAQPAVSNSWDSSVIPEIPSINPSFSHLVTNDHGNVDSSGSLNMQNATNHNVLSAQAANPSPHIPHGLPDAASGLYIPGSQMFGASTTDSSPSLSRAYEQFTTLPSQYLNGNDISPSTQYQFTGSANVTNLEQNQYGNNGHRWSENSHVGFQNPSAATGQALPPVISPNIYYQSVFPHQVQGLQHYVPYQNMVQVPQISNTQPATAGPTRLDAPAVPSLNRQTSFRPRQYGQFPQAGVSPTSTSIHHRRQHRNHSITSSAPPVQQQHTRSNSQNLYVRARPMRDSNSLNVPSPQIQRSHSAVTAVPQVLPTAGGEAHYPPPLTQQEQIELARRLHMREMLRSARSSEHHRLHLYEEDYLRHHRRQQEEAASHCKGLDDQKDGRPEPKDDEELNVNLECKICMSQLVDTVLIPCGHAILCRWCAEQHSRSDRMRPKASVVCPLCRAPVKQKLRIYLS